MWSFDHINHELDRSKLNRISGYSKEYMNAAVRVAALPLQRSASAPADEPPSVFSQQWTSTKAELGQMPHGMRQVPHRCRSWEPQELEMPLQERCTASSSDLSGACSQATSELQISFEKLTPAALLLTHFNFRKESIIWHVTLFRLAAGFVHPSASTCATAWGARSTFYACLHQDTQVFPDLILRPVFWVIPTKLLPVSWQDFLV